jgi:hypothetical protein
MVNRESSACLVRETRRPHSSRAKALMKRHVLHPENYAGDPSFPECTKRKRQVVSARGCTDSAATDRLLRQLAPTLAVIFCRVWTPCVSYLIKVYSISLSTRSHWLLAPTYKNKRKRKRRRGVSSGTVNSRYDFLRVLCESFISDSFWLSDCSSIFDWSPQQGSGFCTGTSSVALQLAGGYSLN